MKTVIKTALATSVLFAAAASAALPYAITSTAVGKTISSALSSAQQDIRERCAAAGRGAPGNMQITDTRPLGMQWQVTVTGNCGGVSAIQR
jgi:hypothetical protein